MNEVDLTMDRRHLDELVTLDESYWWHVAKRDLVTQLLTTRFPAPGRLVEGGIGSSRNLLHFQELGYEVTGFDTMEVAVELARKRGLDDVHVHDLMQTWPIESDSVNAVVLLDVLEHVADPVAVLKNVAQTLRRDGGVVVTVPANPWLYSDWDRLLGHHRRYTTRQLKTHASEAGLSVASLVHWNTFALPAAMVVRGWQRVFPREKTTAEFPRLSPLTNRLLLRCAAVERWMTTTAGVSMPFGLSLVAVLTPNDSRN